MKKVLVLGASGFLAGHLEHRLKAEGYYVVSVARKQPPYRKSIADETNILDLTNPSDFHHHFYRHNFDWVFQMAGEVGGLGYISDRNNDAAILTNSLKINRHTLEAIRRTQAAGKIFFASSQCVYPDQDIGVDPFAQERIVSELDLLPRPNNESAASFNTFAFGQEKLFAEKLYDAYSRNYGIPVAIGRIGNVYGPYCTWDGPRAKAPAALCRKVAAAFYGAPVELWGNAQQTRSFTYVDDAIEGIIRLMRSDYAAPVNIAHAETVTIEHLFEMICKVAGKVLGYKPVEGPIGVMHRGSDNTLCRSVLHWEPSTSIEDGIAKTYPWIKEQVDRIKVAV